MGEIILGHQAEGHSVVTLRVIEDELQAVDECLARVPERRVNSYCFDQEKLRVMWMSETEAETAGLIFLIKK